MGTDLVKSILGKYGLTSDHLLPIEKGYRNESHPIVLADGRAANIILYKDEPEIRKAIRRVNRLGTFLATTDLPARAPIDQRILQLCGDRSIRYVSIYRYLPGETIPWEAYTQKHIKLLGKTLSDLHAALSAYPGDNLPKVTDIYLAILVRMDGYFQSTAVRQAMSEKLQLAVPLRTLVKANRMLEQCTHLTNQHALHMDFVRSNVLFQPAQNEFGVTISGLLDFEKAAIGHPVFDIARTLAFLIVDCKYKPEAKVRKYFLQSGYAKRGRARLPHNDKLLEALINMFLLYDFYKFLRHNPYEYLAQNEHFVRTRNILIKRGVITTTTRYG